jgi:hypothetical protein
VEDHSEELVEWVGTLTDQVLNLVH